MTLSQLRRNQSRVQMVNQRRSPSLMEALVLIVLIPARLMSLADGSLANRLKQA